MIEGFDRHGLDDPAGVGDDRDWPARHDLPPARASSTAGPPRRRCAYRARQGVPRPVRRDARPRRRRATRSPGTTPRWASSRCAARGSPPPTTAAAAPTSSPTTAGSATGDVVAIDERGCIRICDRSKDLIKSGGEWISSVDLENALMAHPVRRRGRRDRGPRRALGRAPAGGRRHRRRRRGLRRRAARAPRERLRQWQLPERFECVAAIPRTATGKWKKTALRELFAVTAC